MPVRYEIEPERVAGSVSAQGRTVLENARLLVHQGCAGVERVEQEMWVDAGLQGIQFGLFGAQGELPGIPVAAENRDADQAHGQGDAVELEPQCAPSFMRQQ